MSRTISRRLVTELVRETRAPVDWPGLVLRTRVRPSFGQARLFVALAVVWLAVPAGALAVGQPTSEPVGLDRYVGRYELTPRFYLTVTREGRALYLQATGQTRAQLTPRNDHEFVIVGSTLRVFFSVRPDTGEVFDLLFEQGGLGRRAIKVGVDASGPSGPVPVVLSAETLAGFVGTYLEQPGCGIVITQINGQLMAQTTEMAAGPIYPSSSTEFFYEDTAAQLIFRRNEAGAVTGLVLRHGGSDVEMTRIKE